MQTDCSTKLFEFEAVDRRAVGQFRWWRHSPRTRVLCCWARWIAACAICRFPDASPTGATLAMSSIRLETLVGQRIFGLALGYEDLNDHDELRKDPAFMVLAGKLAPVLRSDCEALAGKSTLNRVELRRRAMARNTTRSIAIRMCQVG